MFIFKQLIEFSDILRVSQGNEFSFKKGVELNVEACKMLTRLGKLWIEGQPQVHATWRKFSNL